MAFTLDVLAQELGIDPATLTAKGDVVAKWNGYLSEADTKYTSATAAQRDAEAKLVAVQNEQEVIEKSIADFGMTEASIAALRANNAAMEASLKVLKEQGFDVKIPEAPVAPISKTNEFDPNAFRNDVNSTLVQGFNVMNRYQRLFGQPMPDDIDALAREAGQARKPFQQYVSEKYDFGGQEKKIQAETLAKQQAEWGAQAVAKYKEENPITAGNPEFARGRSSQHPQVVRERPEAAKGFANLSTREKIAQSVSRTRQVLNKAS
jgi:hypothetical protein